MALNGKEASVTLIQSTYLIPIVALVAALVQSHGALASASNSQEKRGATQATHIAQAPSNQMNFVFIRKQRIQRVLVALDKVAAVTQQMKPENAERIEPVIVDLAEQAIELANENTLKADSTDLTLTKLETTVTELVHTMSRYVEPEASL
jgi:hypothetical protein